MSAAELQRLRGGSAADQRLAATIENARKNYAPLIQQGARVTVSAPAGNGGQPVVTVVPPGFDASKPAKVWTHYHGFYSTAASPMGDQAGVTRNMAAAMGRDPQTVFVLPECASAPTRPGAAMGKTDWSNVRDITATTDGALRAAGIQPPASAAGRVISAHSGGGAALGFAAKNDPSGAGMKADRLYLMDCCYGAANGWSASRAAQLWARGASPNARAIYFDGGGGNGDKPGNRISAVIGDRYSARKVPSHFAAVTDVFARDGFMP